MGIPKTNKAETIAIITIRRSGQHVVLQQGGGGIVVKEEMPMIFIKIACARHHLGRGVRPRSPARGSFLDVEQIQKYLDNQPEGKDYQSIEIQ